MGLSVMCFNFDEHVKVIGREWEVKEDKYITQMMRFVK